MAVLGSRPRPQNRVLSKIGAFLGPDSKGADPELGAVSRAAWRTNKLRSGQSVFICISNESGRFGFGTTNGNTPTRINRPRCVRRGIGNSPFSPARNGKLSSRCAKKLRLCQFHSNSRMSGYLHGHRGKDLSASPITAANAVRLHIIKCYVIYKHYKLDSIAAMG